MAHLSARYSFFLQCNTANATARKISDLVETKGVEFFGAEVWAARPAEQRCALDFLCGNHTRNLPPNAFNELFELWLNEELGDSFEMCTNASGLNSRLEKSGTALLRSMCKLTSTGFGAYAKGDGDEFHDMLESDENYFAVDKSRSAAWSSASAKTGVSRRVGSSSRSSILF